MSDPSRARAPDEVSFDAAALRERYRVERDRRVRAEGNDQYVEMAGAFAHYLDDPYGDPGFTRPAVVEQVEVLVVGGGFGGLLAGARLREAGIDDFRIIEKGSAFGGTWYWNRYPGAACDTESYIYLPLLEETGYIPRRKYARAPEILAHCERIGRHFDLHGRALFQTVITGMRWDDDAALWQVSTDRGDAISARFVILAGGPLHRPKLPGIPGVDTFKGHTFHTSRWDYAYTGGDPGGGLTGLADKRVGIIGTGATAVQCVPHLGEWAKELYVFQRTPSSVDVRADRPTDPDWVGGLVPGWQRERMDNFTTVISGGDFDVDLVNDGWTDLIGNILLAARRKAQAGEEVADAAALVQLADYQKMERVRARVDAVVKDKTTADALKPWYNQFCKRPCFHDEYLQTFNRPGVRLVDTHGQGVERITERGVVVDGREYELDCLIFATGFEVGTDYTRRIGFEVHGRGGRTLTDKWKNGAETYHGLFSRGFPNCFIVAPLQSGQSANFQHMLDEQTKHIAHVLGEVRARGIRTFEPTETAETEWVDTVVRQAVARQPYLKECTPGYYNNEGGELDMRVAKNNQYWRGPVAFIRILDRWRRDGSLPGLDVTFETAEAAA
ncbi:flavin-containing monooxygenase [Chelatococcus reniformis]|uniref:Monooxygenase n=1 Tax=Chelatococcus reniformis TaxID=1494448 RepID=A0A916XFR7_9HYPH|nr:NAD(P)/FAD-dependent oxidoreductase [Chelatococcus reniformis]GGC70227.1 monooxygenase [Chelatococcus reniformis]